jgi:serine protease AprX
MYKLQQLKTYFFRILLFFIVILISKCKKDTYVIQKGTEISSVTPYQDIRGKDLSKLEFQLDSNIIKTFWFNEKTIFPDKYSNYSKSLMEICMNPGLGIHKLHNEGITGKGVSVAIIDQNIFLDHPEFTGKIIEYYDAGCNRPSNESSMHGPAVVSLLVGNSIGTAPEAKIYYVAAPSWKNDAKYFADALNWIVEKNKTLPKDSKIKAVSVSAVLSGEGTPFTNNVYWDSAYTMAVNSGLTIIDCSKEHGITAPCFYNIDTPDNLSKCTFGYSGINNVMEYNKLYVPVSCRTTAEEYNLGQFSYQYTGRGGISWAEPYLVGVMALGWQLRPDINGQEMIKLLFKSAYIKNMAHIIQPSAFIDSVKVYKR